MNELVALVGGRVIDPRSSRDEIADIVIERGRVRDVGRGAANSLPEHVKTDVAGCWVVPGFVDMHTHLREPGHEYKEDVRTGLAAAAAGGFTTVTAMPNTSPVNDTRAITELILERARSAGTHGSPRLHLFAAITRGLKGEELSDMGELREAGARGVTDDGRCVMNALVMRRAFEYASTFDLLVSQHAEDHNLTAGAQMHEGRVSTQLGLRGWPRAAEDIIVARDLILAETTRSRYHVAHISTVGSLRLLREAKSRGMRVSAEVTPHHLLFSHERVLGYDTACKVNPPLREEEDIEALRIALQDGTIDAIATDHAPHSSLEKDCEFDAAAPGMIGLETAVASLLELVRRGVFTPSRLVEAMSDSPARLLRSDVGCLSPGSPADIAVIDPELRWHVDRSTIVSKSINTPLLGTELRGRVRLTLVNGALVHKL